MKRQLLTFIQQHSSTAAQQHSSTADSRAGKQETSGKRILSPPHGASIGGYCTSVFSCSICEDNYAISWDEISQSVLQYRTLEQQFLLFEHTDTAFERDFTIYWHEYQRFVHKNATSMLRFGVFVRKHPESMHQSSIHGHVEPFFALPINIQNQRMIN